MRKLSILWIICLGFATSHFGQNLVPNFSFEEYSQCPDTEDQAEYATGWHKYSETSTTPDYFNVCDVSNAYGIPQNLFCFQYDNRNCGAYMGLLTWWTSSNYREHIGIQLSQPMITGQTYYLSFYTVMGENSIGGDQFGMPSNNLGLKLSTIAYNNNNPTPIDNFSHLRSMQINSDSVNWQRVSGSIVADSAYNYLVIGNFYDDLNTDTIHYECNNCYNLYSYYLIDDICVSTDSLLCNGGTESLPCNASVQENSIMDLTIFPNPVFDLVNISFKNKINCSIIFYNPLWEILRTYDIQNEDHLDIDIKSLPSGYYYLKILNDKEQIINKIVKI